MAKIRPVTPALRPGFVKREGPLEATGRYIDGNWVRFVNGNPEKMKGWTRWTKAQFTGTVRGAHSWNDLTARTHTAFGTAERLYFIDAGRKPIDITPYENPAGVTLTDALNTTADSSTVVLREFEHNRLPGQRFELSASVGGLTLSGEYTIGAVVDKDSFSFTAAANAVSTVTNGGGTITAYFILAPGYVDPVGAYGWGIGEYGEGPYGTARDTTDIYREPRVWGLDHFGKLLLAAPAGGKLYQFDPTGQIVRATEAASAQGPGAVRSFFITPERYVIALGCSADTSPVIDNMLMRWCTQGDFTVWTPATTNTANARRLTRGRRLIAGTATGSTINLIWTDTALYAHQYTGSQFVFDTRLAGVNCGLAGPLAFTLARGAVYWMSPSGFFVYNGGVTRIPNSDDVSEWVFTQLRENYEVKTLAFFDERYDEVWFLFTPNGATEPSTYCVYNTTGQHWVTGTLTRTSWTALEQSNPRPLLAATDGYFYQHDDGLDANGDPINAWIEAAPFEIGQGAQDYDVFGFFGDWGRQTGRVTLELSAYDRSNEAALERATHRLMPGAGVEDIHLAGRMIAFTIRSNVLGGDFRLGKFKFEVRPAGARR